MTTNSYLTDKEIQHFIEEAISQKTGKVEVYFSFLYQKYKEINTDFKERLAQVIDDLSYQLEREQNFFISDLMEKNNSLNGPEYQDFLNYVDSIEWENHCFYYYNGRLYAQNFSFQKKYTKYDFYIRNLDDLKAGFKNFHETTLNEVGNLSNEQQNENRVKLKWDLDDKQLYYVIRQLKIDHKAINMDYPQLAEFIKQNVIGFEGKNIRTIINSLSRNLDEPINFPKNKRLKVKID